MTDKELPKEVWADYVDYQDPERGLVVYDEDVPVPTVKYIRIHNNPDYHIIKKSGVDGDVMRALEQAEHAVEYSKEMGLTDSDCVEICPIKLDMWKTIKNALIAQSRSVTRDKPDPDIMRIPRKVLEGNKDIVNPYCPEKEPLHWKGHDQFVEGYNQETNDVLNYKEGK